MPNLIGVVLKDRATPTPIDHTFNPYGVENGVATLVENTGVPVGNPRLTMSQNRNNNTGRHKTVVKFAIPVMGQVVVNGVTQDAVLRTAYADLTFNWDVASTAIERKRLIQHVADLCTTGPTKDSILVDLEGFW